MGFGQGFPTGRSTLVRPPESLTSELNDGVEAAPVISTPPVSTNTDGVEGVLTITLATVVQVG